MQKNFALLGLLLLASLAIGLAVWLCNAPTHAPAGVPPGVSDETGTARHSAPGANPAAQAQAEQQGKRDAGSAIVRVAVEASADDLDDDTRPCALRVVVLSNDRPTAGVEVRACVVEQAAAQPAAGSGAPRAGAPRAGTPRAGNPRAGTPPAGATGPRATGPRAHATGHTDDHGVLEFTFVGGHGKQIKIHTAVGVRAETTLSANQPKELRLLLTPRAVATGRVVDGANRPVADAEIVLQRWPHASSPQTTWPGQGVAGRSGSAGRPAGHLGALWTIGRSDRNGRFRLPVGCGGRIGARHPDHAASATYLLRASRKSADAAPVQAFELVLRNAHGTIEGTVRDHRGQPVAAASIELICKAARPARAEQASLPHLLRSDASGRFRASGLAIGTIHWAASAAGHGWTSGQTRAADRSIASLDIRLPEPMTLVGTVVDATSGKPVAGVRIQAGNKATLCYAETVTDRSGTYQLTGLGSDPDPANPAPARTLSVLAKPRTAGRHAPHGDEKASFPVRPGATQTWNVTCGAPGEPGRMLRGFVLDQREMPLAGWTVLARQRNRSSRAFRTGDDGQFAIPVAANVQQIQEVSAFAPGTATTAFASARHRDVDVHQVLRLIVSEVAPSSVFGRVVDDGYRGVPATINCWHEQRAEHARFHADEEGRFDLAIPPGTVELTFEHPGLVTQNLPAVELRAGAPHDLRTVRLPLGGGLFGLVLGPSGAAPADCVLALTGGPTARTLGASCNDGSYRFSDAAPGDYTLVVQGPGLSGTPFPVTIEAGVDLQRDFDIQVGIDRYVRVLVPQGAGDRVTLALYRAPLHSPPQQRDQSTLSWLATATVQREPGAAEGVAIFKTSMQAGSYRASARSSGGLEHRTTISYERAGQPAVILRLTR